MLLKKAPYLKLTDFNHIAVGKTVKKATIPITILSLKRKLKYFLITSTTSQLVIKGFKNYINLLKI